MGAKLIYHLVCSISEYQCLTCKSPYFRFQYLFSVCFYPHTDTDHSASAKGQHRAPATQKALQSIAFGCKKPLRTRGNQFSRMEEHYSTQLVSMHPAAFSVG